MKKILLMATAALLIVGCGKEKFKEINSDPTAVVTPEPSYLFLNAQRGLKGNEYIIWFYTANRFVLPWTQMTVGDRGGLNGSTMYDIARWDNPTWGALYGTFGWYVKDLQNTIDNYDAAKKDSYRYLYQMSQVLFNFTALRAIDYNGDIPYSEALKGPYTNPPLLKPVYDTQKDVLFKINDELKAAVATLSDGSTNQVTIKNTQEPTYGGVYSKWILFANSLRLRVALRLLHADPAKAKEIAAEVAADGRYIKNIEDDYRHVSGKWEYGTDGVWPGSGALGFVEFLKKNQDPRVRFFFQKNGLNALTIQGFLDQNVKLPTYITEQMVVEGGKFIRWKSAADGDGDQYLGEPWVRYWGLPSAQSGAIPQAVIDSYTTSDKFKIKDEAKNDKWFYPYSPFNDYLIHTNNNFTFPSLKKTQDQYKPESSYPQTAVLMSAAESKLILALFALQGVDAKATAQDLFKEGVTASVQAYDKTAKAHNMPYYNEPYDKATYISPLDGATVRNREESIKLKDGEIEKMLENDAYKLNGTTKENLEKVFIQLMVNSMQNPIEIYAIAKFGGVPMYNSNVWRRELTNPTTWGSYTAGDIEADKAINIPRRFRLAAPQGDELNFDNKKAAYDRQGFSDFGAASPPETEMFWYDKNAPAWGVGPIER